MVGVGLKTVVFMQGRKYTYEKLDVPTEPGAEKGTLISSVREVGEEGGILLASTDESKNEGVTFSDEMVSDLETLGSENSCLSELNDVSTTLKQLRIDSLKNVIIGQLNIASLRNKFNSLVEIIHGNIDILILTETKLCGSFPEQQFRIPGYKKPYRNDRNKNGGGVMIYVRADIPSDILLKHKIDKNVEAIFLEINLRKNKILLVGTYHSKNKKFGTTDEVFFQQLGLAMDLYSKYDKFLIAGDFNANVNEDHSLLGEFMDDFNAKNLVKDPT